MSICAIYVALDGMCTAPWRFVFKGSIRNTTTYRFQVYSRYMMLEPHVSISGMLDHHRGVRGEGGIDFATRVLRKF